MKKSILNIIATAALLVAASSANAQTYTYTYEGQTVTVDSQAILAKFCKRYPSAQACRSPVTQVPEIDAGSGAQALALVLGLGLLSAEALRRRRSIPTR